MMSDEWRTNEPDVGQWVEVQHKGICQYLGTSGAGYRKYIDRNGATHNIGNYGWRPLPATHEEQRLRDLLRWRKWPEEKPKEDCDYFCVDSERCFVAGFEDGSWLENYGTDELLTKVEYWRPVGPLPGGE